MSCVVIYGIFVEFFGSEGWWSVECVFCGI